MCNVQNGVEKNRITNLIEFSSAKFHIFPSLEISSAPHSMLFKSETAICAACVVATETSR